MTDQPTVCPPPAATFCEVTDGARTADLAWLSNRATASVASAFDALAVEHGLADLREWLVLNLAGDGTQRTQLEIATQLGIDKSTMVLILDRLERNGLIVRTSSSTDRRVRKTVTAHCLAAFVFNLGIVAFTINVLGGG